MRRSQKNGHTHNTGKQNYQCLDCGRQFVLEPEQKLISEEERDYIRSLMRERISLRGICRTMKISMDWLLAFIKREYEQIPDHLNVQLPGAATPQIDLLRPLEADELWSFVGKKDNKQWVWLAQDRQTRQIVGVHIGDRGETGAQGLWDSVPQYYKLHGLFFTDQWKAYDLVIPGDQHRSVSKQSGKTSHIERFNNTLRQRVSRLVRKSLSFSKKLANHIGAIKYFISHYNLELDSPKFAHIK